jgi:predicted mannosyl-3-phosphoglycerate phosphatase (HAD superfamily)
MLVILTRVEGLLQSDADSSCEVPRDALRILGACGVPLIFVSDSPAHEVRQLQHELGVMAPFICRRGAALHMAPDGDDDCVAGERTLNVFEFSPPDMATAVMCLRGLLAARHRRDVLMVGLGCDRGDCDLLAAVDIPIVVRHGDRDQAALLRHLPNAYVTRSAGMAGWSEALLGSPLQ